MPRERSPPSRSKTYHSEDRNGRRDSERRSSYTDARDDRKRRERDYRKEEDLYGYTADDRERERRRDRERYEKDRDAGRSGPSRRSASPPSRNLRQSRSRSRSGASPRPVDKAKPNFGTSGLLAAETNTVKSVDGKNSTVLKYNEPPEARIPSQGWRLYVFKGSEQVELLHINRQSAYLIGRDRLVADIAVDHPSCSKQHAVIQYRYIKEKSQYGESKGVVKPFIIDLESTNGTLVNDEAIPASRFYELKPSDVIKFGESTREYVLLHDEAL